MDNEEDALIFSILNSKTAISKCTICKSPTNHSYFRFSICSACKILFRRNAEKDPEQFKCTFTRNFEANRTYSRLVKSFATEMEIDQIQYSMPAKKIRKIQHKANCQSTIQTESVLTNYFILSGDQWNHISTLIHCFDYYGPISVVHQFFLEQNGLPVKLRYKSTAINDLITSIYLRTVQVLENNTDYRTLGSHDRSIVSNRTIKYTATFVGIVVLHQTKLLDDTLFYQTIANLFGTGIMMAFNSITTYLDDDITFLKLIIAILFFSTDNCTVFNSNDVPHLLIDSNSIFRIQNTYIELTWKYMTYKHGSEYTVLCFDQLIRSLLHYYRVITEFGVIRVHTDIIHFVINQTKTNGYCFR